MEAKFAEDAELEDTALDWIEQMTGVELDDIYRSLKSGVVLCKLMNVIQPGIIVKINTKELPLLHRENIQQYLDACTKLGVPSHDLFSVNDLYQRKMLPAVVTNIYSLARLTIALREKNTHPTLQKKPSLILKKGKSMIIPAGVPTDAVVPDVDEKNGDQQVANPTTAAVKQVQLEHRRSQEIRKSGASLRQLAQQGGYTQLMQQERKSGSLRRLRRMSSKQFVLPVGEQEPKEGEGKAEGEAVPLVKKEERRCCNCTIM